MTTEQLMEDIKFLAKRAGGANYFELSDDGRDTGMSSNSIVSIAYRLINLKDQYMPSDRSDLNACERMWLKLPAHRKTPDVITAIEKARKQINQKIK